MEDVVLVILGGEIGFSSLEITAADE
jgi:hypothetical protein